jgi:GntR family transcriptional repressor for pyruvate dehydrogenase complex
MLKPIEKPNLPGEIIKQIVSEARSGSLKPGDRLPSERELGVVFNVGRSSIREGLKVLEAVGIVKRTTEGTRLCQPGEMEDLSILLGGCWTEIHEVFETRKLMELELAALAAQRATLEDIKKIAEAIIGGIRDVEHVRSVDIAFHRAIAEAAKNTVFSQVYNLVTGLLFQTHKYYSLIEASTEPLPTEDVLAQHQEILRAIESHDSVAAREAMKQHLDFAEQALIGKVEKDLPRLRGERPAKE